MGAVIAHLHGTGSQLRPWEGRGAIEHTQPFVIYMQPVCSKTILHFVYVGQAMTRRVLNFCFVNLKRTQTNWVKSGSQASRGRQFRHCLGVGLQCTAKASENKPPTQIRSGACRFIAMRGL